ncbi:ATP-dependent DNA helicase PIF1 [Paramuricea clavata]|uniref:ATP-dependent DNA helicase n=1 Tax=Paramuricea clavata TaxID=317549 RepID=A0A7D9DL96_PARCT|nr:ATP-dependent DNA helicase PIF1 [Paramuricea clavata]
MSTFSEKQQLAYDIIVNHQNSDVSKEQLLLIINGEGGTGRSYLINAVRSYLGEKKYIIIDEYSMLGQTAMGWIDRRCRQATGLKDILFGGKSIILIGDPAQLPPVADKPLYHEKPSNPVGILSRLQSGEVSVDDWKLLLTCQPNVASNVDYFLGATRLYYSNEEVAKYNYDHLLKLHAPIAEVHARHSSQDAKHVSAQDMLGLHPVVLTCRGARVMLTMNLWSMVGLYNGSTGTVVDIIFAESRNSPDLPVAVLVKFDNYCGPSFSNMPFCVPIPPVTATKEKHPAEEITQREQSRKGQLPQNIALEEQDLGLVSPRTSKSEERNQRSNQQKIHINKQSKLEDPQESEVTFDIKKVESEGKCKPGITAVSDVLQGDINAVINICGWITLHGAEETILSKGKTLRKQEAIFTDNSGTMHLVLWEGDITQVISKSVYNISKIVVREFDNAKYLTLNKHSIIKPADTSIDRVGTEADGLPHLQKFDSPAEGVLSVQRILSCKKCQTKLVPDPTKNLTKCTECGMAQLKSKCIQHLMANVMFGKADQQSLCFCSTTS